MAVAKKDIFEFQLAHININQNNWNCIKLKFLKHVRLPVETVNALLIDVNVGIPKLVIFNQYKYLL